MLERIHQFPEAYRRKLALGITVALSAVIIALWVVTKPMVTADADSITSVESSANAITPIESISTDAKSTYSAIKENIQTLLKEIKK